jgi:dTDP-4-amino-4,6-dideoxygalactose transaminase
MILVAVLLLQDHGPRADETVSTLRRLGIEARRGYDPLHRTMGLSPEGFPKTEELWERLVLIPLTRALSTRQKQAIHHVLSADSNKRATN